MAVLTKQDFVQASGYETVDVEVSSLGGVVRLRELSATYIEALHKREDDPFRLGMFCLLNSIIDEDGKPIFEDGDYDILAEKGMKTLETLIEAMNTLNSMDVEGAIEDLEETPDSDSPMS